MKLNLGCGPHKIEGFQNWDLEHGQDLRKPFPIPSQSVEFIVTEHFVEHLTKSEAIAFFRECYRVMDRSAIMLISMPDLAFLCRMHTENKIPYDGVWKPENTCDMVNEGMREWGHQYLWDEPELFKTLRNIGFREMKRLEEKPSVLVRPFCGDLIVSVSK